MRTSVSVCVSGAANALVSIVAGLVLMVCVEMFCEGGGSSKLKVFVVDQGPVAPAPASLLSSPETLFSSVRND